MEPRGQVVKAMALISRPRDGALLVSESLTPSGEVFHRPLGGHVEYGEHAADMIRRELAEEIGQTLTHVRLANVLENIFTWDGAAKHEILFIFTAALADKAAYEIPEQLSPAMPNSRSRSRLGSQRRALPVRASICVQASSPQASAKISHQTWFWAKPFSGRFRKPVSVALRIRS